MTVSSPESTRAYGATSAKARIEPMTIARRATGPRDVRIEILFCGICHSDIHQARDEWGGNALFPMVPGHEIVGRVQEKGAQASRFAVGDMVGVGCFVDSCRECDPCRRGLEQFCEKTAAYTYNGTEMDRATPTYGGYSTHVVVDERYVLKMPAGLEPSAAAPLLCAGITTYSPLRQWNCKKGDRVGVVGLGGLGHMAVKLAASMGADVTMLSTSRSKEKDARRLGASGFELSSDEATFTKLAGRFDLLIDTISVVHPYDKFLSLLRPQGTMAIVGVPSDPTPLPAMALILGNKRLAGSMIGGIAETQEMLDYCAGHKIVSDVEMIGIKQVNEAWERVLRNDVRYRFVIDLDSLKG
jgi:uncharacterized zinc-type alcohol dehydrogenase-like protein